MKKEMLLMAIITLIVVTGCRKNKEKKRPNGLCSNVSLGNQYTSFKRLCGQY